MSTKIFSDVILPSETADRALVTDSEKKLTSSAVTAEELSKLSGVTSSVVGVDDTQTLTNKTFTSPVINSPTGLTKSDVGLGNVNNTSDAEKNAATATLTNKTLTSPIINNPTISNPTGLTKSDVGLSNVDNTSDATKNSSVATLTNKTLTSPIINNPTISNPTGLTSSDVGLGNVNNTSDANKPISSATQTALNAKIDKNSSITAGTATKITYDSKGLVTSGSSAALTDLLDTAIVSPAQDEFLKWNGSAWANASGAVVNAGPGVTYFLSTTPSGISGYELMSKNPDSASEVDESVTISNTSALLATYISDASVNKTSIDAGVWEFNLFSYASAHTFNASVSVYARTTGGIETLLFTSQNEQVSWTTTQILTIQTVQPTFSCNATDKIVIKINVSTTSNNVTCHLVHSGTEHYSHFHSPLVLGHNDLATLQGGSSNQYYHLTQSEYTGTGSGNFVRENSPHIITPTGITSTDVGLGNVDNTSDATKNSAAVTLSNKSLQDSTTSIVDSTDSTKKIKFDASGTTGTTTTLLSSQTSDVILTLPNQTAVIATTTDISNYSANKELSNLNSPTAVNQSLIPSTNNTHSLGQSSKFWQAVYTNILQDGSDITSIQVTNRNLLDLGGYSSLAWGDTSKLTSYKDIIPSANNAKSLGDTDALWSEIWSYNQKLRGSTSGTLTIKPAATTTSHTLTMPAAQGTSGQVLTNDGSGNLSWETVSGGSGSGANTTLSNLTSPTSINTNLLPSTDNSSNLGSSSKKWDSIYFNALMDSSNNTILDNARKLYDSAGILSINTNDRTLYNSSNVATVSYEYHTLNSSTGTVLDWSGSSSILFRNLRPNENNSKNLGSYNQSWSEIWGYNQKLQGPTSGVLTIKAANTTTDHTLTMPSTQGSANQVLTNDGSGNLSWNTPTIYANKTLSNLDSTTAINASLLPSVDSSVDLGSATKNWNALYAVALMDNSNYVIIDNTRNLYDATGQYSINTDDRTLFNSSNVITLSYENHTLNNDWGPVLDWSATTLKTYNDLLPNVTNIRTLGNDTKSWSEIWSYNQKLKGSTSGTLTIKAAATTTDHTLTMPATQGSSGQVLTNNGSGTLTWSTPASSGANTSLSNLIATSINQDLIPSATDTKNLGSSTVKWNAAYVNSISAGTSSTTINIPNGYATDTSSVESISWKSRTVTDSSNNVAANWNSRYLYDSTGPLTGTALNWSGTTNIVSHKNLIPLSSSKDLGSLSTYWGNVHAQNHVLSVDGTNAITLKAPNSGVTSHTLTLPATQGSASTVLTNDGSGNLSWASTNQNVVTKSTNYTLTTSNSIVLCNSTGVNNDIIITLPTAIGNSGKIFYIKKIDSYELSDVTINTSLSQTIDGELSKTIKIQYQTIAVVSNGANWFII
jgi:hypothetical protein